MLIVENLDRLSRETVLDALNQFTSIIQAGITIVTLHDRMAYDKESIKQNWTQLIISITYMARAHEESLTKSKRLSSAWENKRKKASEGERKLTAKCPAWMRLSDNKKEYILIPEVCRTVELIYRMKLSGIGTTAIAKQLNQRKDVWHPKKEGRNRTGGWRESYIQKIINTRSVIGEYQPHKKIEGKRVPIGEPLTDYFPPAIDPDLFYQVLALLKTNALLNGNSGGKTGKANNLFTHIVKCGLCGSPMHFIDKGVAPKGGQYLHCDLSRRSDQCQAKPVRYDEFQRIFFNNFEELNIADLLPDEDQSLVELNNLSRQIIINEQKQTEIQFRIDNITKAIAEADDARVRELHNRNLSTLLTEQDNLLKQTERHTRDRKELEAESKRMMEQVDVTREVYALLQEATTEQEKINLRLRLRRELKRLVSSVDIYPLMEKFEPMKEVEPGIIQTMNSRYIRKIRIAFNGSKNFRVLLLKTFIDGN